MGAEGGGGGGRSSPRTSTNTLKYMYNHVGCILYLRLTSFHNVSYSFFAVQARVVSEIVIRVEKQGIAVPCLQLNKLCNAHGMYCPCQHSFVWH